VGSRHAVLAIGLTENLLVLKVRANAGEDDEPPVMSIGNSCWSTPSTSNTAPGRSVTIPGVVEAIVLSATRGEGTGGLARSTGGQQL